VGGGTVVVAVVCVFYARERNVFFCGCRENVLTGAKLILHSFDLS
jgi:hypothetical protein